MRRPRYNATLRRTCHVVGAVSLPFLATMFLFVALHIKEGSAQPEASLGYGFNVAAWDTDLLQSLGFDWMKVFNAPGSRQPVNVLLRVGADASHLGNVTAFGNTLHQLAQSQKGFVEAYEIGNEPNLDASYGWTVSPNAADYVTLLCTAYTGIKSADPGAVVVSAGLAPTGRVSGNWNGHTGHNGQYQDEREFLKEMLAAGGGDCLDAVGYHPYGFSADFDATPDVPSGDPTQNCSNGFCFRGSEKIYQLMQERGLGNKTIWATEFGWIVQPPGECLSDPGWQGRAWQIVSESKQASNLVGAFQYAAAHWPWMEAMFIFNLNFNTAGYPACEQMRFYGVQGRPAEAALRSMPKVTDPPVGELAISPAGLATMITVANQPYTQTSSFQVSNIGTDSFAFTITAQAASLAPIIVNGVGTLDPGATAESHVTVSVMGQPTGKYSATLHISATPGTIGIPLSLPIVVFVVDEINQAYLPTITKP